MTPAGIRHTPTCPGEDVEIYGRTDSSGTRTMVVSCRACRASVAGPWPFGAPPPRPRPAAEPVCPACEAPVPAVDDLCSGCLLLADTGEPT